MNTDNACECFKTVLTENTHTHTPLSHSKHELSQYICIHVGPEKIYGGQIPLFLYLFFKFSQFLSMEKLLFSENLLVFSPFL